MRDACYTCHGTTGASTSFVGTEAGACRPDGEPDHAAVAPSAGADAGLYRQVLPDSDAADLIAYIQSLSQGPAPTGKDIPLLNR